MMQDFRQLKVWQKAHQLTLTVYRLTGAFPKTEQYGMTSQMRRSAASVACNIAEGCGRGSDVDFARFLQMAFGSASELEYQLLLAKDLGWIATSSTSSTPELNEDQAESLVIEVKRMLTTFIQKLRPILNG
jgi:four helix bundle protein